MLGACNINQSMLCFSLDRDVTCFGLCRVLAFDFLTCASHQTVIQQSYCTQRAGTSTLCLLIQLCTATPTFPWVEWQHSVPEATCSMSHRYCAIAHCIELIEATWLKSGWHEQEVAGSCDLVAHGHIEAHPASCLGWVSTFQPPHACLQQHSTSVSSQAHMCIMMHYYQRSYGNKSQPTPAKILFTQLGQHLSSAC